jgi:phytoene synthase
VAIGWALIGLVRAVPFHASCRRVYLPEELNREFGLDVFTLFEGRSTSALLLVVERLVAIAEERLSRARALRPCIRPRALPLLLPATLAEIYIGRLRRAGWNPFDRRVNAPAPSRLMRAAASQLTRRY